MSGSVSQTIFVSLPCGGGSGGRYSTFAVLQGLSDVRWFDIWSVAPVGDRAGDPEDPVDRATAQLRAIRGGLEQDAAGGVEHGVSPQLRPGQRPVERTLGAPAALAVAGLDDALPHGGAVFGDDLGPQQLAGGLPRHRDLQVDPIANRPGKPRPISLPLERRALTEASWVAGKTAGARVGRGDQDEATGQHGVAAGPRDSQLPFLQRLTKRLERIAAEFRDLIHEQDAPMGSRDLTRPRRRAATADQRRRRDGVMRGPERWDVE